MRLKIKCSPQQQEILWLLMLNETVDKEEIDQLLWTDWNTPESDTVSCLISKLKKPLAEKGFYIRRLPKNKYQLSNLQSQSFK